MSDQDLIENAPNDEIQTAISVRSDPKNRGAEDQPKEYAISKGTVANYEKIVRKLQQYSEEKRANDGSMTEWYTVSPKDLVTDLVARAELLPSTITTYKYALLWHLRQNEHIAEYKEALDMLKAHAEQAKKEKAGKRPVGNWKRKAIPKADLNALIEQLTEMSSGRKAVWAGRTQRWVLAGLATGVRPIEWLRTSWVDESKTAIRVAGSKVKEDVPGFMRGSENEEDYIPKETERTIPILNEADRLAVDAHMESIRLEVIDGSLSFERYRSICGVTIHRACKKLWDGKKTYSLYSARKQFSANARAEFGEVRAAELMGHSRPDTPSAAAYGSASQAYSRTGARYRSAPATQSSRHIQSTLEKAGAVRGQSNVQAADEE
jgi:hypothetical protein